MDEYKLCPHCGMGQIVILAEWTDEEPVECDNVDCIYETTAGHARGFPDVD